MSETFVFQVISACYIAGQPFEPGDRVEVGRRDAQALLHASRRVELVAPADAARILAPAEVEAEPAPQKVSA